MTELKPCPYCGNTDLYIDDVELVIGKKYGYCVACKECGMNGPVSTNNETQAIAAWNFLCRKMCTRCVRAVAAKARMLEKELKRVREELDAAR